VVKISKEEHSDNIILNENQDIKSLRRVVNLLLNHQAKLDDINNENIDELKSILKPVYDQEILKTFTLLLTMVKQFVFSGEKTSIRIHNIEENSPWKSDQLSKYLLRLERDGFISFTRDNSRFKLCELKIPNSKDSPIELKRLFDFYTNYYKNDEFTQKNVTYLLQLYKILLTKRNKLRKAISRFEEQKMRTLTCKEISQLIEDIYLAYSLDSSDEIFEPTMKIAKVFAKQPLFLKGISKGGK